MILRAEARAARGETSSVDFAPYHDLQRWIERGPRAVVVLFADRLAEEADDKAVRLRRDFPAVLGLVKASALLHQCRREIDREGQIIAAPVDYATVYELVASMIAEAAGNAVAKPVRETVDAVRKLEFGPPGAQGRQRVTIADVAGELGISRSAASRRISRAMALGYVADVNPNRDGRKILETAEDMPGDSRVLPPPEILG